MHREIRVVEGDGYRRGAFPTTVTIAFDSGTFRVEDPARLFDPEGEERPVQVDVVQVWEDGSIRVADVGFPARVQANGEGVFKFEYGEGAAPSVAQHNPIQVRAEEDPVEVQQGPVIYRIRRRGFNLVDQVIFDARQFLRTGARGMALVLKDGRTLVTEGEVRIEAETRGPRSARLRVEGAYAGGYGFVVRMTFFSGVSWFRAEHEVVSGDVSQIASVIAESDFYLPEAPVSTAFGARERADGEATSWAVVTDNTSTVDVAAAGAWSETGAVRYEVEPDGRFRAIFPFGRQPCILYAHYLITPPMDHHHTPAAAMATDLECRVI